MDANKISALVNSLLVWQGMVDSERVKVVAVPEYGTDKMRHAMDTFNNHAAELIAMGVAVHKYGGNK